MNNIEVVIMEREEVERERILIAEDELHIRKAWQMTLEAEGYEVHACRAGVDARGEIRKWKPHLVVLDLSMPTTGREEGFRVLKYMSRRNKLRNIPVIIATGVFDKEEVRKKLDEGGYKELVREIMIKDFSNEELLTKVKEVLSKSVS